MFTRKLFFAGMPVLMLTACMTTSQYDAQVQNVNARYDALEADSVSSEYAAVALKEAEESVNSLNGMMGGRADASEIDLQLYLVDRRLDIVEETAKMKQAEAIVEGAEVQRKDVLLSASQQKVEAAEAKAALVGAYAAQMEQKASELEKQVANLETQETERGLVLTLNEILFEFDSAKLKPGAERTMAKIADFLNEYPKRNIMVEGFTDSVGSDSYNEDLSQDRAAAVKMALVSRGVKTSRVDTHGYGEEYPVASNDTDAGRQQNRRVEIVVADKENQPVMERQASL